MSRGSHNYLYERVNELADVIEERTMANTRIGPEDRAAMDAEGVGEMLAAPDRVTCKPGCGAEYDTEYAGDEP